jgi:hypothetical protein
VAVSRIPEEPTNTHRTWAQLCELEGEIAEALVLKDATPQLEETDYDNWNGGTYTYRLSLCIPIPFYAELGDGRDKVEARILRKGKELFVPYRMTVSVRC